MRKISGAIGITWDGDGNVVSGIGCDRAGAIASPATAPITAALIPKTAATNDEDRNIAKDLEKNGEVTSKTPLSVRLAPILDR
jgi:hypothetical protein